MVSRTEAKLRKVEEEIQRYGVQTKVLVKDFYQNANSAFYEQIKTDCQHLDIALVVANAGVMLIEPFESQAPSDIQKMLDVDLYHVLHMSKTFLPQLQRRGKSALINVSSTIGNVPGPNALVYAACKGFVHQLTRGVQREAPGVDVQLLEPGVTRTNLVRGLSANPCCDTAQACAEGSLRDLGAE